MKAARTWLIAALLCALALHAVAADKPATPASPPTPAIAGATAPAKASIPWSALTAEEQQVLEQVHATAGASCRPARSSGCGVARSTGRSSAPSSASGCSNASIDGTR